MFVNILKIFPLILDPWLIRKEHKKVKEKKKKKSIDPDSIQSALLASGLGSKRPSCFTSTVGTTTSSTNASGKNKLIGVDLLFFLFFFFANKQ